MEAPCSRDQANFARPKRNDATMPASLPDQRNLQIGRPVLLRIEAAAVDVARAPEQQVASEIDEVVLHEIRSLLETEGDKRLSKNALGCVDGPRGVSCRGDLVEHSGKDARDRSDR